MTIEYSKTDEHEPRYFLLFGQEGPWQEVLEASYVAAQVSNGVKGIKPMDYFETEIIRGTVTTDGSRPKDAKKETVVTPMVRRSSEAPDASYRLVFPEGSYSVASVDENSAMVTVILTPEQYQRLGKAQAPHALDNLASKLEAKAKGSHVLKETILDGIADGVRRVAQDMREDKPKTKRPIQDLKDLLKG